MPTMKIPMPRKIIPPPKEKIVLPKIPNVPRSDDEYLESKKVARLLKRLDSGKVLSVSDINAAFDEWLKPLNEAGAALYEATNKFLAQDKGLADKYKNLMVRIEHLEDSLNAAEESGKGVNQSQVKRLEELQQERDVILPEKYRVLEQQFERRRQRVFAVRRILTDKSTENDNALRNKNFDKMRKRLSDNEKIQAKIKLGRV